MTFLGMIWRLSLALWLSVALFAPIAVHAQLAVPPLVGHITDQTGTLTAVQKSNLEQSLVAFEARKGSQLAVLVVPTTAPETIEQYALRVVEQWKLGRKKVDDGVVLVVAINDQTLRIEVGYGLEGALSDITSKRIISETILPRFKQNDFYGGIEAGVAQIMQAVDGESLPKPKNSNAGGLQSIRQFAPFLFIVALALGGAVRAALGRLPGAVVTGVVVSIVAWFAMGTVMLALLAGGAALFLTLIGIGRIPYGLGGGGGGGSGGFGGGGFRGGGGSFGGGGASGRW